MGKSKEFDWKGVTIAVLDTGIITQTEFLKNCIEKIPGTKEWRKNVTNEPDDVVGTHGTEIACLIHLIAPEAKIYDVKTACVAGRTLDQFLIEALDFCAEQLKPDIINISLGIHRMAGCDGSCPIDLVVNDVADKGIIVVASAGNRGTEGPIACPANAAGAIAVGGATYKRSGSSVKVEVADVSSWSWREGKPELVAPSDIPVRVRYYFAMPTWVEITVDEAHLGTSYAAPFVTGALALLLQNIKLRKSINFVSCVKAALIGSAEPIKGYPKRAQGNGLINLPSAATILELG